MPDNIPLTRHTANEQNRLAVIENRLRDYLLKRRETLLIELAMIEDELKMPRTKEKHVRERTPGTAGD